MTLTKQQIAAQKAKSANMKTANAEAAKQNPPISPAATSVAKSAAPAVPAGSATTQTYNTQELAQLWIQAGGDPAWADTMAAVAYYGESGGDATIVNGGNAPGTAATGLWQIDSPKQSAAFNAAYPPASMTTPLANAKAAVALLGNGGGISNWTADYVGQQVVANGNKPFTPAQLAQVGTNLQAAGGSATVNAGAANPAPIDVGAPSFAQPTAGVNIKNFHGFDLSAFMLPNGQPGPDLGNAEASIAQYLNPNVRDKNGSTLLQRVQNDFGYTVGWALKHPEVGAVLIWSAQHADPSTAAGKAQEMSYLQKTQWYQTTSENQRAFEAAQSTDHAKAGQAMAEAQDKVHATALQIGVTLTPQQLNRIAAAYAAQAYTPSGTFAGSAAATQEFIDPLVIAAVTTVQKTGGLPGVDQTATFNPTAVPAGETGIASQLFQSLKGVAQSYLMYSSSPSSPLTDADLNKYVASYMQNYTGAGSYGSSNLQQGAIQSFTGLMQQQASALHPTLAPVIKMGTTPQTYTKPITNLIENTLGLTSGSVDLTQPKWNWALGNDPTTGAPMTQDQILAKTVQMPEYNTSDTAINNAHAVANGLTNLFGQGA